MKEVAKRFGTSLDEDDFNTTKTTLSEDCKYIIGNEILIGPENICRSYEQNMQEGRKKLDVLEWGQSWIEPIDETRFYVHFTDYLTPKGQKYIHRCKQRLTISDIGTLNLIEHIFDQEEQNRLDAFYQRVGLK